MLIVRRFDRSSCVVSDLDDAVAEIGPEAAGPPGGDDDASNGVTPVSWYWIDVTAPTRDEEAVLARLGVDALLEEDMRDDRHLPKVELAGQQLLLVVHALRVDDGGRRDGKGRDVHQVATSEVDALLSSRLLVTWHRRTEPSIDAVGAHFDRAPATLPQRPMVLLHQLLDAMTDVLIPFVDHFERRLDVIEEDLLSTPTDATRDDLYRLQRDVIQLRRVVVPQAEVMRRAVLEVEPLVGATGFVEADLARFRDIYDHLFRLRELSDSYTQLLASALDTYRAAQDDELNDMLRVLTLVSALLLPISVLAGIWGTNFVNLPGDDAGNGFWILIGCFVVLMVAMGLWFRTRGWIGRKAERDAHRRRARLSDTLDVPVLGTILKVPVAGARTLGRGTRHLLGRNRR